MVAAPVAETVAPLSAMPVKGPPVVGVACWLADRVRAPSTVVMLAPEASPMLFSTVMLTTPVPLAAMSLVVFGRLTVPTSVTVRPWSAAKVIGPLKFTTSVTSSPPITSEA